MSKVSYPVVARADARATRGIDEIEALIHPDGRVEFCRIKFIGNAMWDPAGRFVDVEPTLHHETVAELEAALLKQTGGERPPME